MRGRRVPRALIRSAIAARPLASDAFIAIELRCPVADIRLTRATKPKARKPPRVPGPPMIGETHRLAKLNADLVRGIRAMADAGASYTEMMAYSGVSRSTCCKVARRQIWTHVAEVLDESRAA